MVCGQDRSCFGSGLGFFPLDLKTTLLADVSLPAFPLPSVCAPSTMKEFLVHVALLHGELSGGRRDGTLLRKQLCIPHHVLAPALGVNVQHMVSL